MVYENIKRLCDKNAVSIYALEKGCGISNGTIWKWKHGETRPTVASIRKIADYFGVKIGELLEDGQEENKKSGGEYL